MLLIRRFEEAVITLRAQGLVPGHPIVYIGQEAIAVPAMAHLRPGDTLFSTHRNHGHILARGADPGRLLAEILCRDTGYNRGLAGQMHPSMPELGILQTSAIVANPVALATGAALAAKYRGGGEISVAFFGDGCLEEGVFYESLNLAAIWKLPVVYVCENNSLEALGYASGEYPSSTLATGRLTDFPAAYGITVEVVDGADTLAVSRSVGAAVERARTVGQPSFVEARTVRWPGSRLLWPQLVTGETNLAMAWDSALIPEQHGDWLAQHDPVLGLCRELLSSQEVTLTEISALDESVKQTVDWAVRFAVESPEPVPDTAYFPVFAGRRGQ